MKSILLTSTALIGFAGAATAGGHTSFGFSGEASAEYNTETGYSTSIEATATMTAVLDNGLTATAELTFDPNEGVTDEVTSGSITLSNDSGSLTFGTGLDGAVFTATGDDYLDGIQDGEEGVDGVVGSMNVGAATVTVSLPVAEGGVASTDDLEIGVTTDVGGFAVGFGILGSGDYALTGSGTVGGADLSFGMSSDDEWDVGVDITTGAVTLSASTDEAEAWTIGAAYAAGEYSAGIEYNADETWEVTAGYAAGGIAVDVAFTDASVMTLGATYDMGDGLVVGAGIENADNNAYAFAEYTLGGGASAYVEYADGDMEEVGPSERDIADGTTVGVSFEF
ncbi:porin [Cognatiyoonia sp.]|uniref:porin n=1 Tax=Cognatiyoonia sp. TaxID=2211652 RepID=UPI003F69E47C